MKPHKSDPNDIGNANANGKPGETNPGAPSFGDPPEWTEPFDVKARHREGEDFLRNFPEMPFALAVHSLKQIEGVNDFLYDAIRKEPRVSAKTMRMVAALQRGNHLAAAQWMTLTQTYIRMGYAKRSATTRRAAA